MSRLLTGALVGGAVATVVGSATVLSALGAANLFLGLYFLLHPGLRALPPVADADEEALGL